LRLNFIGDVHGMTERYQKILRRRFAGQQTFQLGDMGVGFPTAVKGNPGSLKGGLHPHIMGGGNHRWIRGNHDNPAVAPLLTERGYAGDFGYDPRFELFWVGGAYSIDRENRTMGFDWWPDEELSYTQLQAAIDLYLEKKPKIVASHEAPSEAAKMLLLQLAVGFRPEKLASSMSRTSEALQWMFDQHRPQEWVFGHYHIDKSWVWKGTKFTCVNELSVYTISDEPLIVLA
jgi:Calcineurin-like phosphoesterase